MLIIFVVFIVGVCIMSITPEQLEANIIASVLNDPMLQTLGNTSDLTVSSSSGTYTYPPVSFTITGSASALVYGDLHDLTMSDSAGNVTGNTFSFGTTTLTAGDNNSVIYGNLHDLTLSATQGHTFAGSNAFTFAGNSLSVGNGNNVIYSNLYSFSTNATNNSIIGGSNVVTNSLTLGNNMITAGNGSDVIYGNMHDLTLSATGGATIGNYYGLGNITNVYSLGSNIINVGNGDNVLYGSVRAVSLTVGASTDTNPSTIANNSFSFGGTSGNSLTAGAASNVLLASNMLYGDMATLSINVIGGSPTATNWSSEFAYNTLRFAGNSLTAGLSSLTGAETLIGSIGTLSLSAVGDTTSVYMVPTYLLYNSFNFGANTLTVGNSGSNVLIGDIQNFNVNMVGGSANSSASGNARADVQIADNSFTFGNTNLTVGSGNSNVLVGNIQSFTITSTPGTDNGVSPYPSAPIFWGNSFSFGSNTLKAGNGNSDTLVGSIQSLNWNATGADAGYVTLDSISSNSLSFGNNTLTAGNGGSLTLIGDILSMNLNATSTQSNNTLNYARISSNGFYFGSNSLTTGTGSNDLLVGGIGTLNLSVNAGTANAGAGTSVNDQAGINWNTFTFGSNSLTAAGTNATLVGGIQTLTMRTTGGSATATGSGANADAHASISNNTIVFGNNILKAGNGANVTLYGDIQTVNFSLTQGTSNASGGGVANGSAIAQNNTIILGNNTLIAGSGNDIMYASTVLNAFAGLLAADPSNHVIGGVNDLIVGSGTDTLYGGYGTNYIDFSQATSGISFNLHNTSYNFTSSSNGIGSGTLNSINGVIGTNFNDTLVGNAGNTFLYGGEGNDSLKGGTGITTAVYSGNPLDYTYSFAHGALSQITDTVAGRDGSDTLSSIQQLEFGGITGMIYNSIIYGTTGNDVLVGGSGVHIIFGMAGNDTLIGSTQTDTSWAAPGGTYNDNGLGTGGPGYAVSISTSINGANINYASDVLVDGNGTDLLIGNVQTFDGDVTGGTGTISGANARLYVYGSSNYSNATFGSNDLTAGSSSNDSLTGDVQTFNWHITGGTATVSGASSFVSAIAQHVGNHVTFGSNYITEGSGSTDTAIGGVQTFNWDVTGGNASATASGSTAYATATSNYNIVTFGNSILDGGSGSHDVIVGDMQVFSFSLTQGTATASNGGAAYASATANYDTIHLGNNTLTGVGNNVTLDGSMPLMDGSMSSLQMLDSFVNAGTGNTVIGGHDVLIAGNGSNNFLFGGFGSNVMTGGTGQDTFVFDLAPGPLNSGANTITNFNTSVDYVQLHDVLNVATANAQSTVTNDGAGHPLVTFNQAGGNGTSIDFVNMTYSSTEHVLTDVIPTSHLVIA
jgi:hypothetical protein